MPTLLERFEDKYIPEPNSGCWLWLGPVSNRNYGLVHVSRKMRLAHRVSYELYKGSIPNGLHVLHSCDTPACVNPEHLRLGTHSDNMRDAIAKGRKPPSGAPSLGMKCNLAKLTDAQIIAIRNDPRTIVVIGLDYGVTNSTISKIKTRRTWKHLP